MRSSQTRFQTLFRPLKVNGNAIPTGSSALAVFLIEPLAAAINFWPQRFNPSLNTIEPHITVAYSPFMPSFDWPAVCPVLAGLLAEFQPFTISLRHTNVFWNPGRVLWLEPEDGGVLVRLDACLKERFPQYFPASELLFTPHATLGFFDSDVALLEAQRAVEATWHPLHFLVDAITLGVNLQGVWKPSDSLKLGPFRM